ncbi:MAG: NAD-dependent epimerase/dehydratase family protein [Alphaproteobacteria bacterium]|nr:NAD-dependent epimerase/dehydratase family protein [Alphaproteobacteria bacterium]
MTTLITGATGFVGSAVLRRLVAAGHTVRALVRPSSDRSNLGGVKCEIVVGDLSDPASLRAAVRGCEAVFHVAADYRLWVPDPDALNKVNIDGSVALFRAAADAGATRMVYTSSVATLGLHADGTPADEETPSRLDDMVGEYKRSKFRAEAAVRQLVTEDYLPIVIVNPSAPIGPRDIKPTPTGKMILDAAAGRMPAYVDTGLNVAHVDDVADGHMRAFDRGVAGERYILGGANMSLREILVSVAAYVERRPPRIQLPHGLIMPIAHVAEAAARMTGNEPMVTVDGVRMAKKKMYFTCAKAERDLGYAARPPLGAIHDAVDWFRAEGYL